MKYIKFNFYSIILVLSMIILSGCNSELLTSASTNEEEITEYDLSDYPIAVRNGDVSPEYYDGMMNIVNNYAGYLKNVANNETNYEKIKEISHEYLASLSTNSTTASTSVDFDLDKYLTKYVVQTEMVAEYYIDYATKQDSVYLKMVRDYKDDVLNTMDTMITIGNEYGLNEY